MGRNYGNSGRQKRVRKNHIMETLTKNQEKGIIKQFDKVAW